MDVVALVAEVEAGADRIHLAVFWAVLVVTLVPFVEVFVAECATAILNNSVEREAVSEEILVAVVPGPERTAVVMGLIDTLRLICRGVEERFRAGGASVLHWLVTLDLASVVRGEGFEIEVGLLATAHSHRIVTNSV